MILLLAVMALAAPPTPRERLPEERTTTHRWLVVEVDGGETIRADDPDACETAMEPPGEAGRLLLGLAGLESGALSPDESVTCDSTCWTDGGHGECSLALALAYSCDTYFRRAEERVAPAAFAASAVRAGFDERGRGSARDWVEFWRGLLEGELASTDDSATLLAAAAVAVSSPRGAARALFDPELRIRAMSGATDEGAWVSGLLSDEENVAWFFALFVPDASVALALARADRLLHETYERFERSTSRRNEAPPR